MQDNPYQVTTSEINWLAVVQEAWGPDWGKPDIVYRFSNGREFQDPQRVFSDDT